MKKIGITGGLGTGKTKVLEIIKKLGSPVISSDEVVHSEMKKGQKLYNLVVENFGKQILAENGEIDRSKLAEIVFNNKEEKEVLERLIHPRVKQAIIDFFSAQSRQKNPPSAVFAEVPLLFEVGWEDLFDQIWVVWVPQDVVYQRLLQGGRFSPEDIRDRLKAQMPLREKIKKADQVIENKGTVRELERKVQERWKKLNAENRSNCSR